MRTSNAAHNAARINPEETTVRLKFTDTGQAREVWSSHIAIAKLAA